jgi:hypothetical protein
MKSKIQQRRNRRISRRRALRGGRPLEKAKQEAIQNAIDQAISMMENGNVIGAKELLLSAKEKINNIDYDWTLGIMEN